MEIIGIEGERKAAVSISGVELHSNGAGGRSPRICYALRLLCGDDELGTRRLPAAEVEKWLAEGGQLVREAFEWAKSQDGVAEEFVDFAVEFERAYEHWRKMASVLAKGGKF